MGEEVAQKCKGIVMRSGSAVDFSITFVLLFLYSSVIIYLYVGKKYVEKAGRSRL